MMRTTKISTMGLLTAAMLLGGMGMAQAQTVLEASHTTAVPGEAGHEITVNFTNIANGEIAGYEFEFPLPGGYLDNLVVTASDPEVDPGCAMRPNGNAMFCMVIADTLSGLPPHVLSIRVDIDADTPDGVIPLVFEGVLFADPDANNLPVNPDNLVNGSITITQPPVYSSNPAPGSTLDVSAAQGSTVQLSVTISNSGADGLDYDCSVSGTGFSIASGGSASGMDAGASSTVVVNAVAPAGGSSVTGTLSCAHNDPINTGPAQYTLNISAPVPPPAYSSTPAPGSTLSESAAAGTSVPFSVVISNTGAAGLDYNCSVSGAGFSIASGGSASNLAAGASSTLVVNGVAPAAGSTAAGAVSCTHNDPAITGPAQYSLSLSAPALSPSVFCDGFEADGDGSCPMQEIVFIDDVDLVFPQNISGAAINWMTGDICNCDSGDYHFNIWRRNGEMAFYFPIRVPGETGAVADADGVVMVLQSGDTIGPQASYTVGGSGTYGEIAAAWRQDSGVQGYLGFRFLNTDTGQVNYGYAEMTTTGPTGYPVTIHRYWFNAAGNPITIP